MFSVPGWNVTATLKAQTQAPNGASNPESAAQNSEVKASKGKKRKRGHGKEREVNVNGGNMVEMWERVVEGKEEVGKATGSNGDKLGKKRKKNKEGKEGGKENVNGNVEEAPAKQDTEAISQYSNIETSKPEKKKQKNKKPKDSKPPPEPVDLPTIPPPLPPPPPTAKLTPLQKSMRQKLASARFRHLNESLYTTPSTTSLSLFAEHPEMFSEYHLGFSQQVDVWPENPVDSYVASILSRGRIREKDPWKEKNRKGKKRGKGAPEPDTELAQPEKSGIKALPRGYKGVSTIADLGCGVASLSLKLQPHLKPLNLIVHSFDLAKPEGPAHPLVTVADVKNLPLPDSSVDVAVFCLALMGTNWTDFIDEAFRILRWRGELWVAEIKSRFGRIKERKPPINSVGSLRKDKKTPKKKGGVKPEEEGMQGSEDEKELTVEVDGVDDRMNKETDISAFVEVLRRRGFVLDEGMGGEVRQGGKGEAVDLSNKMFVKMQFVKGVAPVKGKNVREGPTDGRKMGGKKFVVREEVPEVDDETEAKVLKPCVYKLR